MLKIDQFSPILWTRPNRTSHQQHVYSVWLYAMRWMPKELMDVCVCVCVFDGESLIQNTSSPPNRLYTENVFRQKSTRSLNLCNRKWESRMLNLFWFRRWWKCMLIHWNASHYIHLLASLNGGFRWWDRWSKGRRENREKENELEHEKPMENDKTNKATKFR